jgi:hypothetical protein
MQNIISINLAVPSSVVTIQWLAFARLSVKSLLIPPSTMALLSKCHGGSVLDRRESFFLLGGDCLIQRSTNSLVRSFSDQATCVVPSIVETIGVSAFERQSLGFALFGIDFPDSSRLMRIEKRAFLYAKLVLFTLPQNLEFVGPKAFDECPLRSLTITPGNCPFEMRDGFLVGIPDQRLIRYCGQEHDIIIPNDILILGNYSLADCSRLTSISFAAGSTLKAIEYCVILNTDLPSFEILASVERIDGSAFWWMHYSDDNSGGKQLPLSD